MPTFAVLINVDGPLRDASDGKQFDGAYSRRFVTAVDARVAEQRAVESLCKEPQFADLKPLDGFGTPLTRVDEIREVRWYEAFFSKAPLVMVRKRNTGR